MAHYFDTGFTVRTPAWHRLATVIDDYPGSWDEARKLAGLDWEPITVPTYEFHGIDATGQAAHAPGDGVVGDYFEDAERRRIVRSDTGDTLAIANDSYELVTHAEMGDVVEAILEQPNIRYETAGSLEGGKAVWALALLDEPVQLAGDISLTLPYLAIQNRHDGGSAFRVSSTSVRIVCANTFRLSEIESERAGTSFAFKHTRNWRNRIDDARAVITGVRRDFAAYCEEAERLLGIRVTPAQRELFVREFVPAPPEGLVSDRVMTNVEAARDAIRHILASPTTEPVAHTAFGLVQAAGEYADHVRRARSWETRLGRQMLEADPVKAKAAKLVREIVTAG